MQVSRNDIAADEKDVAAARKYSWPPEKGFKGSGKITGVREKFYGTEKYVAVAGKYVTAAGKYVVATEKWLTAAGKKVLRPSGKEITAAREKFYGARKYVAVAGKYVVAARKYVVATEKKGLRLPGK